MADKFKWLPILSQLGEDVIARILDNSPDAQTAILEAHQNFERAESEAEELRKRGHGEGGEGEDGGTPPATPGQEPLPTPPTPPGEIETPG